MNELTLNQETKPWYREPFVWLIITFPMAAVLAGFYTLYLAVVSYDGLVVDDYYKEGLAINKRIEKQDVANAYGLRPQLQFDHDKNRLRLILAAEESFQYPETIKVMFSHATRQGHDQVTELTRTNGSIYEMEFESLIRGHWNVTLEANDWRLYQSIIK